jgi:hypothetical protein
MKVIATRRGTKWYARVEQDGVPVAESHTGEPRVGCAIRQVMNKVQVMYGDPADGTVTLTVDDW